MARHVPPVERVGPPRLYLAVLMVLQDTEAGDREATWRCRATWLKTHDLAPPNGAVKHLPLAAVTASQHLSAIVGLRRSGLSSHVGQMSLAGWTS
jgi:hypothetical protein